nr:DUF4097 family beta strand repeat-containing protein [Sedimentibacter sp.]
MKKIGLSLVVILILALFTGCTSDFKINDAVVKDISDKITHAVIETVDSDIKSERHDSKTVDSNDLTELIVKSEVGDIEIVTHESTETLIDTNIKARSNTKEAAEELVKSFDYSVETKGKKLSIDTTEHSKKSNSDELIVDLVIKIPSNIEKVEISSNVGDINIESINGNINLTSNIGDTIIKSSNASYYIKTDVGDINVQNSSFSDSSTFYSNVGDININANDISIAKNLSFETNVGDIKILIPKNSNYEANIQEFLKDPKIETVGTGKTKIKLITHVGNIDLE